MRLHSISTNSGEDHIKIFHGTGTEFMKDPSVFGAITGMGVASCRGLLYYPGRRERFYLARFERADPFIALVPEKPDADACIRLRAGMPGAPPDSVPVPVE